MVGLAPLGESPSRPRSPSRARCLCLEHRCPLRPRPWTTGTGSAGTGAAMMRTDLEGMGTRLRRLGCRVLGIMASWPPKLACAWLHKRPIDSIANMTRKQLDALHHDMPMCMLECTVTSQGRAPWHGTRHIRRPIERLLRVRCAGPAAGTTATGTPAAGTTVGAPGATGRPPATTAQWSPRGTTVSATASRRPGACLCPPIRRAHVCMRLGAWA